MAIPPPNWTPEAQVTFHTDMRIYFLKMVELTNEMYRKRKSEYADQDTEEKQAAYAFARAANSATMRVRRNAYKEWCETMDYLFEQLAKRDGIPVRTVCNEELTEAEIITAQNNLSVESKIKLAGYVEQILGQLWLVNLMHKNFEEVLGQR